YDNAANSTRLAGYGTVDLRLEWNVSPAWSLQARAANVFDRQYETVSWYNQPGRGYQVSVRYRSLRRPPAQAPCGVSAPRIPAATVAAGISPGLSRRAWPLPACVHPRR